MSLSRLATTENIPAAATATSAVATASFASDLKLPTIINDYQPIWTPCFTKNYGDLRLAIRSYSIDGKPYYLAVDPYTFQTTCAPMTNFSHRRKAEQGPGYYTHEEIEATPYVQALNRYTREPYILQNHGATHAEVPVDGVFWTIDMCPSVKPFEKDFFQALASYSFTEVTPIAVCMTGAWLIEHEKEFHELTEQARNKKLAITWANHSFSHVYYTNLEFEMNFLLSERTNLSEEILGVERELIKRNETPSVFARAPGLVTNKTVIEAYNRHGLIPLGSNAWLAKDEKPENGSFILVHGNSNEPAGIKKAMEILKSRQFRFFSLPEAFAKTAETKKDAGKKEVSATIEGGTQKTITPS